jgi:RHS repeat-associated protein
VWQRFEYDAAGRLKKVMDDSTNVIENYTYGATRERLITETSSGRTYYVWGGQNVIAEYTETSSGTIPEFFKSYVYVGSRLLMVSYSSGTREFHHPDRLGTELVTYSSQSGSPRQSTYPFGTLESGPRSNQVFTSYDRSTNTGLDYAVTRTYSSGQSRFTQVDPIGMLSVEAGNPQSNNLYAYVQNMPTDFVDPSGLLMRVACYWAGQVIYGDFRYDVYQCLIYYDGIGVGGGTTPHTIDTSGGGTGPGYTPPGNPPPSSPPGSNQKDYDDCVRAAWRTFRRTYLKDGGKPSQTVNLERFGTCYDNSLCVMFYLS